MKKFLLTTAFAVLFAAPLMAQAAPGDVTPDNAQLGAKDGQDVRPGGVGPGSEKNSQVSPTSPSVPTHSQPPPEIPAGASGSSTGASGASNPPPPPSNDSGLH
jgi:hypothetical protein